MSEKLSDIERKIHLQYNDKFTMKRFFKWIRSHRWESFKKFLLWLGVALCIWGILVYEFKCLDLAISCDKYEESWSKFSLAVIYGLLTGYIVYFFTVILEVKQKRNTLRPVVYENLAKIYSQICFAVWPIVDYPVNKRIVIKHGLEISTVKDIIDIIGKVTWDNETVILSTKMSIYSAMTYYLRELYDKCQSILLLYSEVLNENEIRYLNGILTSDTIPHMYFLKNQANNMEEIQNFTKSLELDLHCLVKCINSLNEKKYNIPETHLLPNEELIALKNEYHNRINN